MLQIERKIISYQSSDSGRDSRHHILIARERSKYVLLSHANLFIHAHALRSIETSNRYSGVIAQFYRFLSTEKKYTNVSVATYHVLTDNRDIKRWQVVRQISRVKKQKTSPSSSTIFDDAKIVLTFFDWMHEQGYPNCVNVIHKTWQANFKTNRMLNYVRNKARISIDSKNIEVLDKESRQRKRHSLITDYEIKALIESYDDPVYSTLFKLSLGTAMRPMDLCKFPYIGNGANRHIMPYSSMDHAQARTVDYLVKDSKGKKSRTIKITLKDLKMLEDDYIRPHYAHRARLYEKKFGRKCPPTLLFLNRQGLPVSAAKISSRTNDAKNVALKRHPDFREKVKFYDARHWWPTMFLIKFFKGAILTESADALNLAAAEVLSNQMGHEDISTTYKYYIDMARLIMLTHNGIAHDLVTDPSESVGEFLKRLERKL